MLTFLFLFLSFAQVGLFGLGGDAGAQALLEHETITLHQWLNPAQMADLMTFGRILPGGTALNTATLTSTWAVAAEYGFWGTVIANLVSALGLALPAMAWTGIINRWKQNQRYKEILECALTLLRPLVPGLIVGAAFLMMHTENIGSPVTTPWDFYVSLFLFFSTIIGISVYHFKAGFMIFICGLAGCLLL